MKTKRILTIAMMLVALPLLTAFAVLWKTQPVEARVTMLPSPAAPVPTPNYTVKPSGTDNGKPCSLVEDGAIGCDDEEWAAEGLSGSSPWGELAINAKHYLYLPTSSEKDGKLLLFLCGGGGSARFCENVYPVAAQQGYHVIGLTYPTGFDACPDFSCFGDLMRENITGEEFSDASHIHEHPQDSIVRRLIKVLEWAVATKPIADGWAKYLTIDGEVDWTQVNIAGFSNGSSHASRMGTLYPDIARVALFAGPNDGDGHTAGTWDPASYIQLVEGITDTRYYGLVHILNKAPNDTDDVVFKVTNNWFEFGMEGPDNPDRFEFVPDQTQTPAYFFGWHMLISKHSTTDHLEAHNSVVTDYECDEFETVDGKEKCKNYANEVNPAAPRIGYEPAWRCILGTGGISLSSAPIANAGPNQTVECEGSGGANVNLDGSGTRDLDCGVLTYTWTSAFGVATGRKPTVFLPVGTHLVTLEVKNEWSLSDSKTVLITVHDTQPPSLQVTLTPTLLWPPNHELVRINATINIADGCGSAPPQVVLTSITSNQPDNGGGDGDTVGDIQEAAFGTDDRSFLLRAERAGGDPRGRTYTVTYTATDGSGNQTQAATTVRVPHSR